LVCVVKTALFIKSYKSRTIYFFIFHFASLVSIPYVIKTIQRYKHFLGCETHNLPMAVTTGWM